MLSLESCGVKRRICRDEQSASAECSKMKVQSLVQRCRVQSAKILVEQSAKSVNMQNAL